MDILAPLIRNVFYPMWMIKDGDYGILRYLNYFDFIDRLTRSELEERQSNKLNDILKHAYKNTRYYKEIFDESGFNPHNIKDRDELRKIPQNK